MDSSQDFNGSLFCVVSDLENPNLDFFLDQQLSLHSQYRNAMLKFKENLIMNSL